LKFGLVQMDRPNFTQQLCSGSHILLQINSTDWPAAEKEVSNVAAVNWLLSSHEITDNTAAEDSSVREPVNSVESLSDWTSLNHNHFSMP